MKRKLIFIEMIFIFVVLMGITIMTYATFQEDVAIKSKLILNNCKMEKIDFNKSIETVISVSENSIPKINDVSTELLEIFEQKVTDISDVQKVYENT